MIKHDASKLHNPPLYHEAPYMWRTIQACMHLLQP